MTPARSFTSSYPLAETATSFPTFTRLPGRECWASMGTFHLPSRRLLSFAPPVLVVGGEVLRGEG